MVENLKLELKNNGWVVDILLPPVRQKIAQSTKDTISESTSTTYLTSVFYNPAGIESVLCHSKYRTLALVTQESNLSDYFSEQIRYIFKTGNLAVNDTTIRIAEGWIEEFNNFCNANPNYETLGRFLEYAILLENVNFRGASHPHFLGSLFLQLKPDDTKFDFLVSIIHEAAHQELFLINFVDRLVNAKFDHNLIHAPYQNKVRPPIGRIHSLHALYRMNQFILTFAPYHSKSNFFKSKFNSNLTSFADGELTEFGNFLLREVYEPFSKQYL